MANNVKNAGPRRPAKKGNVQIGERCHKAREAAGYTQEKQAEIIGRGSQFVSDMERCKCGMLLSTFMSLFSVLSVSADYLLFGWTGRGSCRFPLTNGLADFQKRSG